MAQEQLTRVKNRSVFLCNKWLLETCRMSGGDEACDGLLVTMVMLIVIGALIYRTEEVT